MYLQGMSELPDFKKIEFSDMPPIPLEEVVPDASPEVSSIIPTCTSYDSSSDHGGTLNGEAYYSQTVF